MFCINGFSLTPLVQPTLFSPIICAELQVNMIPKHSQPSNRTASLVRGLADLPELQLISNEGEQFSWRKRLLQRLDSIALDPAEVPLLPKTLSPPCSAPKSGISQTPTGNPRSHLTSTNKRSLHHRRLFKICF